MLRNSGLNGVIFILSIVRQGDGFFVTLHQVQ
nr:MAG TPA: hypothetical protein [Caudoviricetes sp.]